MNILTFDLEDWFQILDNESTKDEEKWDDITIKSENMIAHIKKEISMYVNPETCHNFSILRQGSQYHIAFHCRFDKNLGPQYHHWH